MIHFARPRDAAGQFSGGEAAGSPEDMAAAYGHPAERAKFGRIGSLGAAAVLGGAAAAGGLKLRQMLKARKAL